MLRGQRDYKSGEEQRGDKRLCLREKTRVEKAGERGEEVGRKQSSTERRRKSGEEREAGGRRAGRGELTWSD